jgi:hypothetical protein
MRRVLAAATALISALPLLFAPSVRAQTLPSKQEAAEWVRKAIETSYLEAPGAPPFHLVATIHYTVGEQILDGSYEILWAAPDRYRLELRLGSVGETDVILGNKKYVARTTPTMSLAFWSVSGLFDNIAGPPPATPSAFRVAKVTSVNDPSGHRIRVTEGGNVALARQFDFDASSFELVAQRVLPKNYNPLPETPYSVEMTDYRSLGKLRYAGEISKRNGPEHIIATLQKLEPVQIFGDDVFVPLASGAVWDWCAVPEIRQPKNPPPLPPGAIFVPAGNLNVAPVFKTSYLAVYKIVAADGQARQVTQILGPTGTTETAFVEHERRYPSPIHICDGHPIEYETVLPFWPLNVSP